MSKPARIVRYLRDCYEADNRESAIFNLRHEKVRHLHFLSQGGEFLRGLVDVVPLDRETAVAAQKSADLYQTEKALVFCAFMIVGTIEKRNQVPANLFAPLIFFPASVRDEGTHACLSVDRRQQRINSRVLAALMGGDDAVSPLLDDLLSRIPPAPFAAPDLGEIMDALRDFLPEVDAQDLFQFPQMVSEKVLDGATQPSGDKRRGLKCYPACAMALIPNSPDTRGVLSELTQIAAARAHSRPLKILLGNGEVESRPARSQVNIRVPASLNKAQQKVLYSAAATPLTLIIGPPGTGKSYTVATVALDHILRGQSVLIASKMNQALDVLAQKIGDLAGDSSFILRGGRAGYSQQLKDSLDLMLQGLEAPKQIEPLSESDLRQLHRRIIRQAKAIAAMEKALAKRALWELSWGGNIANHRAPTGLLRFIRMIQHHVTDWKLDRQGCYWQIMAGYQQQLQEQHEAIAQFLRCSIQNRMQKALQRHRRELVTFSRALRARTNRKQEELFGAINLRILLQTFPVWMTTLADTSDFLPLKPELFDLALVDEATQCDMASCLPVFFRARRAAITGDPQQLRHLSFVSGDRQRLIAEQCELAEPDVDIFNYRDKSILDLMNESIASQEQVIRLDEHFRSRPQIIAFSNREFYQSGLKIMTERPETSRLPTVVLHHVAGRRSAGGPNTREAKQLVDEVVKWIESEEPLDRSIANSLGILSPFREQVDHISSQLSRRVSLKSIQKHRLRIGTAHSFQGEERDIMFVSFAVDPETHAGSFRYLNRPDVFNVSITRARNLQVIFCSIRPEEIVERSLFKRYLEEAGQSRPPTPVNAPRDSFLQETREALESLGFITWPSFFAAGMTIDLLVERDQATLGIDLVGYPGPFAHAFDLEKYRMFQRAGLRIFPLPYSAWRKNKAACLEAIQTWTGPETNKSKMAGRFAGRAPAAHSQS